MASNWGETIADAARREVWEETGLNITPGPAFTAVDAIHRDDQGRVVFHYVIVEVVATVVVGARAEPRSDVDAVRWIPVARVGDMHPLTPLVPEVVHRALREIGENTSMS
ncbi:MAG: NUDIX domain-containing protein [Ardenticatenia bacterium]|nr:NUDIX domain-containing protein [Ardenticatenia bacterium]